MLKVIRGVEYMVEIKEVEINGKKSKINCLHPVLEPEEQEARHQEFLRVADRILQKYNFD